MRIWFRKIKDNHLVGDLTVENYEQDTRTHKIFSAVEEMCSEFDLSSPIWLKNNISDFQRGSGTRFRKDSFIDDIDFDYLEMTVLEEDW